MSQTKHRSSAGKSVAVFFIVFMILEALVVFGVSRVFKNKDVTPSIAGYSMYIMDSDKMGDAVPKGSLVLAANGAPSVEGVKKAVIAEDVPGIGTSVFWLADVSTSADLNGVVYTVFQEKNPTKLYQLRTQNIVGTASTYYQTAGNIITFMTSKFGIIALFAVPLFLLVLIELIIMVSNRVRYSESDDDDDDDDDEGPAGRSGDVKLDDFLFGGESNDKLIKNSMHREDEEDDTPPLRTNRMKPIKIDEDEDIVPEKKKPTVKIEEDETKEEAPKEEAPKEEAPAAKAPDIDPEYYERAAKLIDGDTSAEEKPDKKEKKPAADDFRLEKKGQGSRKSASASLEDLMKLMEQESDKLKNQLDKK